MRPFHAIEGQITSDDSWLPEPESVRGGEGPFIIPIVDPDEGVVVCWANNTANAQHIVAALNAYAPAFGLGPIQACEPESLPEVDGITWWDNGLPTSGSAHCPEIHLAGRTPELLAEYLLANWGDEDKEWYESTVASIRPLGATVEEIAAW